MPGSKQHSNDENSSSSEEEEEEGEGEEVKAMAEPKNKAGVEPGVVRAAEDVILWAQVRERKGAMGGISPLFFE